MTVHSANAAARFSGSGITKRFGVLAVLENVDFSMGMGEAVGIVGPNGAGKTTLLATLSGAYQPSAGTVAFGGHDVTRLPAAARCRLGLVRTHQVPKPFSGMTTFENVYVAAAHGDVRSRDEAYERTVDSLTLCGMLAVANRRAETLGLLDRKRLELARALATGPKVILLDEIGGGLTDLGSAGTGGDDQGTASARHRHRLDRAYRPCAAAGGGTADLHGCRPHHRRWRAEGGDVRSAGGARLSRGKHAMTMLSIQNLTARHGLLEAVRGSPSASRRARRWR